MLRRFVGFFVTFLLSTSFLNTPGSAEAGSLTPGKPPPDLGWQSASGDTLSWDDLAQGRPLVMVFWATWCKACRKEWPKLQELATRYADAPCSPAWASVGLGEPPERVARVAKERGLPGVVLVDPAEKHGKELEIAYVPTVVVVGSDGHVLYSGPSKVKKIERLLATLTTPHEEKAP
jgi:thiol-disulfide isomerase/thioredoxin